MIIYVEDFSGSEIQAVIDALNLQASRDFLPAWSIELSYKIKSATDTIDKATDAVMYLQHALDVQGALGYHDKNNAGVPYAVIGIDVSAQLGEPYSVTMSHEGLELAADPEANITAMGPAPRQSSRNVFWWYEDCDPVQADSYMINGVAVSNFVFPVWFIPGFKGKVDFLGKLTQAFQINHGGYAGYYDPRTGRPGQVFADSIAENRMAIKDVLGIARRAAKYSRFGF